MTLKPGDVCEVIGCEDPLKETWFLGEICTVERGPLMAVNSVTDEAAIVYMVSGISLNPKYRPPGPGQFIGFREEHLRKINDGDEKEVTSWEDCVWQPKELVRVE